MTRIFPTEEELNEVITSYTCPICMATFKTRPNLNLHLSKTHKQPPPPQQQAAAADIHLDDASAPIQWYYCPVLECVHNAKTPFAHYKNLKQHYLKVHKEKTLQCPTCVKKFTTQTFWKRHTAYCNVHFYCFTCTSTYACYDTLQTHCRRKNHRLEKKDFYRERNTQKSREVNAHASPLLQRQPQPFAGKFRPILPKLSTQTTQTTTTNVSNKTATTQTSNVITTHKRLPSITDLVTTTATNFDEDDDAMISSSTQTITSSSGADIIENFSPVLNNSIHTDTSDLFASCATDTLDSTFFNMETQTEEALLFTEQLFSDGSNVGGGSGGGGEYFMQHMYTQTHTADFFSDCASVADELMFVSKSSVESQTHLDDAIFGRNTNDGCGARALISKHEAKDSIHMHTQTDCAEFEAILNEINNAVA